MAGLPFEHFVVVLDTSVIVKWFREVLANRALIVRDAYLAGQITVVVPSLVAYELANVLRYKDDLSTDQVQKAVGGLFAIGMEWMPPSSDGLRRTVEIARTYNTTVYDAAFAALAEGLEAAFLTADERLARQLSTLPFVHFLGEVGEGMRL
jgi:predicted nucleic acid-binding protein